MPTTPRWRERRARPGSRPSISPSCSASAARIGRAASGACRCAKQARRRKLAAANAAHGALAAERDAAQRALDTARNSVHAACKAVLIEEADRITAELDATLITAHLLQDRLLALSEFSAQGRGEKLDNRKA